MAGDCDLLLRVFAADLDNYRQFPIENLRWIEGVQSVKPEIPMQKIKLTPSCLSDVTWETRCLLAAWH